MRKISDTETTKTDAFLGISSFMRGSSHRIFSSNGLGWNNVSPEFHNTFPVERDESLSPSHLIAVFPGHSSRGEVSASSGRFVPYLYRPGVTNLLPAGPIPACRPFNGTKMIVCSLKSEFVAQVGEELDFPSVGMLRRTSDIQDQSLKAFVKLRADEASAGGFSGRLHAEHLSYCLAMRFLLLEGACENLKLRTR